MTSRLIFLQFLSLLFVADATVRTAATFVAEFVYRSITLRAVEPADLFLNVTPEHHFLRCFLNPPKRAFFFGCTRWITRMASFAKP